MIVAFPTQEDRALESEVYGHFGSANAFLIVDLDTEEAKALVNRDRQHAHGQCQPLAALNGHPVDAVVVGGIGRGALMKLNAAGIAVYRAVEGSVADNMALLRQDQLPRMMPGDTCAGHGHQGGGCAH